MDMANYAGGGTPTLQQPCIIENQLILHSSNGGFEMRQLEFDAYFVQIGAFIKSIYADQSVGK